MRRGTTQESALIRVGPSTIHPAGTIYRPNHHDKCLGRPHRRPGILLENQKIEINDTVRNGRTQSTPALLVRHVYIRVKINIEMLEDKGLVKLSMQAPCPLPFDASISEHDTFMMGQTTDGCNERADS